MFKATEVEKKIREINLLVDVRINLFMQNFRPFYLPVFPAIVMGLVRN